jgi:hypothetical protein
MNHDQTVQEVERDQNQVDCYQQMREGEDEYYYMIDKDDGSLLSSSVSISYISCIDPIQTCQHDQVSPASNTQTNNRL